jgi:Holliday junction resolvasome RuvABC endonuclease subunit
MTIVSIDPGYTGGICIMNTIEDVEIKSMPTIKYKKNGKNRTKLDVDKIVDIMKIADVVVIEKVWTRPNQGISSNGKLMKQYGIFIGIAHALKLNKNIDIVLISPAKWKREILGMGKHDKDDSVKEALNHVTKKKLLRTPRCRKPSDGMAESLLIGIWYLRNKMDHIE